MKTYKNLALFVLGTIFGSAGFRILKSEDAKAFYVEAAAAGLRMKDETMDCFTALKEEAGDILAQAKEVNEARKSEKTPELIEDTSKGQ